jgi:predicted RNA-binding protein with PIN domain
MSLLRNLLPIEHPMRYLIDGYNLLFAMGLLSPNDAAPHALENARVDFLARLHALFGDNSPLLTVIFDAARMPRRGQAVYDYRGIHVQFAPGEEADDLIETLIRSEPTPKNVTIVSDDHRVQTAARRGQCAVLGCQAFLDVADKPPTKTAALLPDAAAKPESVSPEDRQHWLDAFGEVDDDPLLKKWRDPDFIEVDE